MPQPPEEKIKIYDPKRDGPLEGDATMAAPKKQMANPALRTKPAAPKAPPVPRQDDLDIVEEVKGGLVKLFAEKKISLTVRYESGETPGDGRYILIEPEDRSQAQDRKDVARALDVPPDAFKADGARYTDSWAVSPKLMDKVPGLKGLEPYTLLQAIKRKDDVFKHAHVEKPEKGEHKGKYIITGIPHDTLPAALFDPKDLTKHDFTLLKQQSIVVPKNTMHKAVGIPVADFGLSA